MTKLTYQEVIELAIRAGQANQPNVAKALYAVAGRMDRSHGADYYDADEAENVAEIIGRRRADRMSKVAS